MNDDFSGEKSIRFLHWIIGICIGIYVLQQFVGVAIGDSVPRGSDQFRVVGNFTNDYFALIGSNLQEMKLWTLLTYGLFHGSLMHLCFNIFVIFMVGKMLENSIGSRNTLTVFIFSTLTGGAIWVALHFTGRSPLVGASAGAAGMIVLFAMLDPNERIDLLLFFVYPIRIERKWIALVLLGMDGIMFLLSELPPLINATSIANTNIAYSAHLGGMLGGFLFAKWMTQKQSMPEKSKAGFSDIKIEPPEWEKKAQTVNVGSASKKFKVNITNKAAVKAEVDRILDKINTDGFGSLNDQEKEILGKYGEQLRH